MFDNNSENTTAAKQVGNKEQQLRSQQNWGQHLMEVNESTGSSSKPPLTNVLKLVEEIEKLKALVEMSKWELEMLIRGGEESESQQNLIREIGRLKECEARWSKLTEELQKNNAFLENNLKLTGDELERVKQQYLEKEKKCKEQEDLLQKYKDACNTLRKKMESLEDKLSNTVTKLEYDKLVHRSQKLEEELSDCKTRLSRVMGNKLSDNNPEIADLSDKNRPTKIAEKFQEIYDNQWTDAFEVVNNQYSDEHRSVETLKNLLTDIKRHCDEMHQEQLNAVLKAFTTKTITDKQISTDVIRQVKELRKTTAEVSVAHVHEQYLKGAMVRGLAPEQKIMQFIESCVETCWLMTVQDPPLAFGQDPNPNELFDTNKYKYYTQSGLYIQFVVWPTLLLKEGGAVLSKGIAQAFRAVKQAQTNQGASVSNVRELKNSSVASDICQSTQEPPTTQVAERSTADPYNKHAVAKQSCLEDVNQEGQQKEGGRSKNVGARGGHATNKNQRTLPASEATAPTGSSHSTYPSQDEINQFLELKNAFGYSEIELKNAFSDRYELILSVIQGRK